MNTAFERSADGGSNVWLTPPWIVETLGPFDLDPCFLPPRPWDTARGYFDKEGDGLTMDWYGFVWCNPPYGRQTGAWLKRMSEYKDCIGLVYARTETKMFRDFVWCCAKSIFFFHGRLRFYRGDGLLGGSSGAPSVLIAWSDEGTKRLERLTCGKLLRV